jgi:hypothetical protein
MSSLRIDWAAVERLTAGRIGVHDVACPLCGPTRRSPTNRRRRTLRIWRADSSFAGYICMRCGARGYARRLGATCPAFDALAQVRVNIHARIQAVRAAKRQKALALWRSRLSAAGSIVEYYLRRVRAYSGPLPGTIGLLPAFGEYPPAMITAFGLAHKVEPGLIAIADNAVTGVHLTRLRADGSAKAGSNSDKIMLGDSLGSPIVLAPPSDGLALAITEGIEDGLSVFGATGLGAWAAGSASRLPGLADALPGHIESVTILVDHDDAGHRHAAQLVDRLRDRSGLEVRAISLRTPKSAA